MTVKIKVCGLTDLNDIKKIEKLAVDHIGFINIERSKRNVPLDTITYFKNQLTDRRESTLVLEPKNAYETILKIDKTGIFNIQLHSLNNFDIRYLQWLNQYHNEERIFTTKAIGLRDKITMEKKAEIEKYCLFTDNILFDYVKDGLTGGTNTQIPIETAIEASQIVKNKNSITEVTLAGGLNLEYLEEIQDKLHYFDRIDLNSGVEDKPGKKNIRKIKQIIKLIKE